MKWAQRGGSIGESKQEMIGYHPHEAGTMIQEAIDKYAVLVKAIFVTNNDSISDAVVWVLYEEDLDGD